MGFRRRLSYYLVHRLGFTNKGAKEAIASGGLYIDDKPVCEDAWFDGRAKVSLNGKVLQEARPYTYLAFYKPAGIETTYNLSISDNLSTALPPGLRLPYAGRLDKASEGLLLLSDDGRFIEDLSSPSAEKEKEYEVKVDGILAADFAEKMSGGIIIQGYRTKPCLVTQTGDSSFTIVLTEGRNRQIRRMCYKLGYNVVFLKRVRIDGYLLGDLQPGEWRIV